MYVYLDHNIIDDISKRTFTIKAGSKIEWVYSDENLKEIERSGSTRFLDVLNDLKARRIRLILDYDFKITGNAFVEEYRDTHEVYNDYLEANSDFNFDDTFILEMLAHLFGSQDKTAILSFSEKLKSQLVGVLSEAGIDSEYYISELEKSTPKLDELIKGDMQEIKELELTREHFGTHKSRASNLSNHKNPIKELWKLIEPKVPESTAEQFFGFDPIDKQGHEDFPIYLGITGCHLVLNVIGFNPDKGLPKVDKLKGILSDGVHIAMASFCSAILSRDKKLCKKAKAIYEWKEITTTVHHLDINTKR